jgi:hypothetical protein
MPDPYKPREAASPLDAIVPTNPLAAIGCYTGIFSIICCPIGLLLGPLAIVLSVIGLNKWKMQESAYGATTSKIRAWVGIITGILGTLVGIVSLISIIASNLK